MGKTMTHQSVQAGYRKNDDAWPIYSQIVFVALPLLRAHFCPDRSAAFGRRAMDSNDFSPRGGGF
jgi:hypothetical protein